MTKTQEIYIAYYGRPADPAGATYWETRIAREGLVGVIEEFGKSTEFTERFGDMGNETLINAMYQRLFNRDADEGGLAFYLGKMESGEMSLQTICLNILHGAQNNDVGRIAAKVAAADTFTTLLDENPEISYKGIYAAEVGTALIDTVGSVWTQHWHEYEAWEAEYLNHPVNPDHHPDALPLQFLSRLMLVDGVMDVDTVKDIPSPGMVISFDETPIIKGVFNASVPNNDRDKYIFHDLQPGNYSIVLDVDEAYTASHISRWSTETEEISLGYTFFTQDSVLNFTILEETDLGFTISGRGEDAPYTITVTQTNTPYAQPVWDMWESRDMDTEGYEYYYDQVFGVPPTEADVIF